MKKIEVAHEILSESRRSTQIYLESGRDYEKVKAHMYSIFECYAHGLITWNQVRSRWHSSILEYLNLYASRPDLYLSENQRMLGEYENTLKTYKPALDEYKRVNEQKMVSNIVIKGKLNESQAKEHSNVYFNRRALKESELKDTTTMKTWKRVQESYPNLTSKDEMRIRMLTIFEGSTVDTTKLVTTYMSEEPTAISGPMQTTVVPKPKPVNVVDPNNPAAQQALAAGTATTPQQPTAKMGTTTTPPTTPSIGSRPMPRPTTLKQSANNNIRKEAAAIFNKIKATANEGYKVLPPVDKERYDEIPGLEGPFTTLSGKVVYYDPKEGAYYDRDSDMYLSNDEYSALNNDYSGMRMNRESAIGEGDAPLAHPNYMDTKNNPEILSAFEKQRQNWLKTKPWGGDVDNLNDLVNFGNKVNKVGDQKAAATLTKGSVDYFKNNPGRGLGEAAKPDFLDMDKDGNKKEPMKKAVADAKNKVSEAQSMADALKNALSKPEPGSKLHRNIQAHNNSIKHGSKLGDDNHNLMAKAPAGHHFDKKGMIRLGEETEVDEEAEKQLFMDPDDKMWKVSYDHGPHQSNTIKVKAKSQSHAWEVAKEVAKKKYGHARITSGSVTPVKEETEVDESDFKQRQSVNGLKKMIDDHDARARNTTSPLKKDHHRKMSQQLRDQLADMTKETEVDEVSNDLKSRYIDNAKTDVANRKKLVRKSDALARASNYDNHSYFKNKKESDAQQKKIDSRKEMIGKAKASMKEEIDLDEANTSYEKDMDHDKPVVVSGVKGMKSTPFRKKFKNMAAYDKWSDSEEAGNYEVHDVMNEAGSFSYGKKPRKGTVAYNAAEQRKKQEKNEKPIEPKDQKVGNAKVTKESVAESYTGRETKEGTWRVFKTGDAVAVAGPFKSKEEAAAWIKKQSVKEKVKESVVNEAVTLDYSRYMRAHGKKPRDAGYDGVWMFTTSEFGDPSEDETFEFRGSFADAKKAAAKWAKSQGENRFYVME